MNTDTAFIGSFQALRKLDIFSHVNRKAIKKAARSRSFATAFFTYLSFDEFVKSRNSLEFVIPAKAGIQLFQDVLDPGFRRGDDPNDFLRDHHSLIRVYPRSSASNRQLIVLPH